MDKTEARIFVSLMRRYLPDVGANINASPTDTLDTLNDMLMMAFMKDPTLLLEDTAQKTVYAHPLKYKKEILK